MLSSQKSKLTMEEVILLHKNKVFVVCVAQTMKTLLNETDFIPTIFIIMGIE